MGTAPHEFWTALLRCSPNTSREPVQTDDISSSVKWLSQISGSTSSLVALPLHTLGNIGAAESSRPALDKPRSMAMNEKKKGLLNLCSETHDLTGPNVGLKN